MGPSGAGALPGGTIEVLLCPWWWRWGRLGPVPCGWALGDCRTEGLGREPVLWETGMRTV